MQIETEAFYLGSQKIHSNKSGKDFVSSRLSWILLHACEERGRILEVQGLPRLWQDPLSHEVRGEIEFEVH